MAELVFYSGTMNCGKSTLALQTAYNYHQQGLRGLIFTRGTARAKASSLLVLVWSRTRGRWRPILTYGRWSSTS